MNTFTVKAQLPSLNTVISKNRANRYMGAKFKKDIEEVIGWAIKQALTKGELKPIQFPCVIYIEWHEATKRRDVDNVQSSQKFVLDAMVQNGVLPDDNRRWVKQVHHQVIDDKSDFVVIKIEEIQR